MQRTDGAGDECCCGCDCEDEGASPVADFSYEQVGYDPCVFDFTDDSVAGTCGEIVSWLWEVDGDEFSTSQNPTDIEFEGLGPWDVTLTVTDSEGCEDAVIMEVVCDDGCCFCFGSKIPDEIEITFTGWTVGTSCEVLNTTFTLQRIPEDEGPEQCVWGGSFHPFETYQGCDGTTGDPDFWILVTAENGSGLGAHIEFCENNTYIGGFTGGQLWGNFDCDELSGGIGVGECRGREDIELFWLEGGDCGEPPGMAPQPTCHIST